MTSSGSSDHIHQPDSPRHPHGASPSRPSPPPRSQPINMRRVSDHKAPDLSSLSPPAVSTISWSFVHICLFFKYQFMEQHYSICEYVLWVCIWLHVVSWQYVFIYRFAPELYIVRQSIWALYSNRFRKNVSNILSEWSSVLKIIAYSIAAQFINLQTERYSKEKGLHFCHNRCRT